MVSNVIIKAENLSKKYGDIVAVNGIDFEVSKGQCTGFLGPNGAGKTTAIRMVHCFLPITSGKLTVAGMNVQDNEREIKQMIGVSPQETNLDPDFRVLPNL